MERGSRKCAQCAAHGHYTPYKLSHVKGECPFTRCPCSKCEEVRTRRHNSRRYNRQRQSQRAVSAAYYYLHSTAYDRAADGPASYAGLTSSGRVPHQQQTISSAAGQASYDRHTTDRFSGQVLYDRAGQASYDRAGQTTDSSSRQAPYRAGQTVNSASGQASYDRTGHASGQALFYRAGHSTNEAAGQATYDQAGHTFPRAFGQASYDRARVTQTQRSSHASTGPTYNSPRSDHLGMSHPTYRQAACRVGQPISTAPYDRVDSAARQVRPDTSDRAFRNAPLDVDIFPIGQAPQTRDRDTRLHHRYYDQTFDRASRAASYTGQTSESAHMDTTQIKTSSEASSTTFRNPFSQVPHGRTPDRGFNMTRCDRESHTFRRTTNQSPFDQTGRHESAESSSSRPSRKDTSHEPMVVTLSDDEDEQEEDHLNEIPSWVLATLASNNTMISCNVRDPIENIGDPQNEASPNNAETDEDADSSENGGTSNNVEVDNNAGGSSDESSPNNIAIVKNKTSTNYENSSKALYNKERADETKNAENSNSVVTYNVACAGSPSNAHSSDNPDIVYNVDNSNNEQGLDLIELLNISDSSNDSVTLNKESASNNAQIYNNTGTLDSLQLMTATYRSRTPSCAMRRPKQLPLPVWRRMCRMCRRSHGVVALHGSHNNKCPCRTCGCRTCVALRGMKEKKRLWRRAKRDPLHKTGPDDGQDGARAGNVGGECEGGGGVCREVDDSCQYADITEDTSKVGDFDEANDDAGESGDETVLLAGDAGESGDETVLLAGDALRRSAPLKCPECQVLVFASVKELQDHIDVCHSKLMPMKRLQQLFEEIFKALEAAQGDATEA